MKFTIGLVVAIILIGGGTYWYLSSRSSGEIPVEVIEESTPVVSEPEPVPEPLAEPVSQEPEPVPEEPLPSLDEADSWVFGKLKPVLTHPVFQGLFKQTQVIRNWVVAMDRLARGENAYRQLHYFHPGGAFEVSASDEKVYLSADNFRRTTAWIDVLNQLPQQELLDFYRLMEPLVLEAYAELGNPEPWSWVVERVHTQVQAFRYPDEPIELVGREGVYIFKDPELEARTPLEKAMIRMGSEHANQLQKWSKSTYAQWEMNFHKKNIDKDSSLD